MSATVKATGRREAARPGVRWVVQCEHYTTSPVSSRESAERLSAQIEAEGKCYGTHRVVEVVR